VYERKNKYRTKRRKKDRRNEVEKKLRKRQKKDKRKKDGNEGIQFLVINEERRTKGLEQRFR
jgi:hypothetical protein